ncbi:MAG: hypothetical protein KDJ20_06010 [Hyphomicrobiales bacterium]|nr:hypothetical protein [Methylobacteriaceae bacterium]MCC2102110.1 hypothetical protein [Hyphomicrobiales bacterium]MCC2103615.1 hypothetical protein [Hyphomicrobiales bacterium]
MAAVDTADKAIAANPVRADLAALATPEKSIIALVAPLRNALLRVRPTAFCRPALNFDCDRKSAGFLRESGRGLRPLNQLKSQSSLKRNTYERQVGRHPVRRRVA